MGQYCLLIRKLTTKLYNSKNGLTHLLTSKEDSYTQITKDVFQIKKKTETINGNFNYKKYRVMRIAKKGAIPYTEEIEKLSLYFYGSIDMWPELFFPNTNYVTNYLRTTVNNLIEKYSSVPKYRKFVQNKNKFNISTGLFNKNETLEKATMTLIWYTVNNLYVINRHSSVTTKFDYYDQIIPYLNITITKIMPNTNALIMLRNSIKNEVGINNISDRTINLTMLRTLITLI